MEKTEKFFIFTWKELIVIVLLVLTLLGFFFTLGLHYGKKIVPPSEQAQTTDENEKLEESPESLPSREALESGSQHSKSVGTETIKDATKEEVAQTGVKVEQTKAVQLPGEKTIKAEKKESETKSASQFSIQLGSYVTKKEAQLKMKIFAKKGIETEIRTAEVNHQMRFRLVIPGFKSKASADLRGKELRHKHKIDNFVVINSRA